LLGRQRRPYDPLVTIGGAGGASRPGRVFYGWYLVGALAAILFLSAGLGFYSQGVFVTPLEDEFGWSRGEISAAMAISTIVSGLSASVVGVLLGRVRVRVLMGLGAAWMAVTFGLLGLTPSLLFFYAMFFLMAAGRAGIMIVPTSVLVARWFNRRRGLAMGAMTTGIGFGGLVMAPVTAAVISALGWRWAFGVLGVLIGVVALPLILLVVREWPADLGLQPDGDEMPERPSEGLAAGSGGEPGWTLRQAWRTPAFIAVSLALGMVFFSQGAVLLHVAPFLEDRGISRQEAGFMLGFVSGVGVIGKLASGYLCDRVAARLVLASVFLMQALGLLIVLQTGNMAGVAAFVLVFGYAMGAVVALQPLVLSSLFGSRGLPTIMGGTTVVTSLTSGFGPMLAGYIRDGTGSYSAAFITFIIIDLVAAVLVLLVRRPVGQPEPQPAKAAAAA